jgi:hypothetical protein
VSVRFWNRLECRRKLGREMLRPVRFAALAALVLAACAGGFVAADSFAQSNTSFQSSSSGTVLVAVMPQTAHVGWWVLPAEPSWFAHGYSGNLLVIEQKWSIARGTSVDAECTVAPRDGEVAELMPLEQFDGQRGQLAFLDRPGVSTVSLAANPHSGDKEGINLQALVLAHTEPLAEPITVHIRLVAF